MYTIDPINYGPPNYYASALRWRYTAHFETFVSTFILRKTFLTVGGGGLLSLTPLEPQSRFGDNPLKFQVLCPQIGTSVLKGLTPKNTFISFIFQSLVSSTY